MLEVWTRSRAVLSVRGLLAVAFGILVVAWPNKNWFTLLSLYSAYALADGIALFVQAAKGGSAQRSDPWPLLLVAVLGVGAGIATLYYWGARPDLRVPDLPLVNPQLIALMAWAIARGIYELTAAIRLRREIAGEWLLSGAAVLSVVLAILLAVQFASAVPQLTWLTALCLIAAGALYFALSLRLARSDGGLPRGALRG